MADKNADAGTPKPNDTSVENTESKNNSETNDNTTDTQDSSDSSSKDSKNNSSSKNSKDRKINVVIEPDKPKEFTPKLRDLMDRSMNLSRMSEQGLINEKNGAAVVVREDGIISLSSSKDAYLRLTPQGRCVTTSFENVHISNRETIRTDEVVINDHKLNPQLWELTNFKETNVTNNQHVYVGNLCMCGSVLVKAWEPNLKRYMLIRRPWRGPVFGTQMNVAEIMPALGITDPLKLNEDILALSDKGYQVNGAIKDKNSLIGKDGKDRPGVIRNVDAMGTDGGANGGSGGWDGSGTKITAVDQLEFMHKFGEACVKVFKKEGWCLPASVCTAQACIESGFGQSERAKQDQNYLGYDVPSDDSVGGQFNSVEQCIYAWGKTMSRPDAFDAYRQAYTTYQSDHDPYKFIATIAPTYAADKAYTGKVSSVIKGNSFLIDYDKKLY